MESKKALYGWLTTLADGEETLIGALIGNNHTPLIASNRGLMERFRPIAVAHAAAFNQPIRFVRFDVTETIEQHEPVEKKAAH